MGKGKAKISIKKIENLQRRNVTFTKRRQGLFKKADEFCRLFPGTRVAALVFSPAGKPYIFGDPKSLLGAEQQDDEGLGVADLGNPYAVKLPGPDTRKRNRSDWESDSEDDDMNTAFFFGDPSSCLLGADEQKATSLDGNQFAGLGNSDAVKLPGPDRKKQNWDFSQLVDLDVSDSEDDMPFVFGYPSSCLLGAEQKATSLDEDQFAAGLGNLDAVMNMNYLPGGLNDEKGTQSDWDSPPLLDLSESDSDYMNEPSNNDWDLNELASQYIIHSEDKRPVPSNTTQFTDLGELESMLMDNYFDSSFLADVEAYANELLEL